jgi:hypothetical protein
MLGIERGNKGHRRKGCFGIQMSAISSDEFMRKLAGYLI